MTIKAIHRISFCRPADGCLIGGLGDLWDAGCQRSWRGCNKLARCDLIKDGNNIATPKWLWDKSGDACLPSREGQVARSGHHNDWQDNAALGQRFRDCKAVRLRHVDVEQDAT